MSREVPNPESVFAEIIEIESPEKRAAFLDQACCNDPEFRREMEKLVFDHFRAGQFMENPAVHFVATAEQPIAERPGTLIGPYKLLEQIGEGGMGLVFVAEQQQPVRRRVALKLIKPGMDSRQVIARFEAERQALALMDHPNIAKVHDGGATPEGRPYFVMELVKGKPITDYCDRNQLGTRQRLELFLDVCQAVQHAHQKGIIHRDLKPSNILVEVHDVRPVVKIIDFGIAKAIGQQLTDKTMYTGVAQMIGTPLYMSPEQAGLSSLDVDTRSDVYALGVLLYELLTGTTPFDGESLKKADFDEMRRIVREDEPPKPSARLSTLHDQVLSTIAEQRGMQPRQLGPQLRGELDWIVMKALEKDRNRRYESAGAFAADVRRHLNDEPVEARPPTTMYMVWKMLKRNRRTVVTASILIVTLLLGSAVSAWKAVEAQEARSDAEEKRKHAEANYEKARELIRQLLTRVGEKNLLTAETEPLRRRILEDAAIFYEQLFALNPRDPRARAERANVCQRLGKFDEAIADYKKALVLEPDNPDFHIGLASVYISCPDVQRRDLVAGLHHSRLALEINPKKIEAHHLAALAYIRRGMPNEARGHVRKYADMAPKTADALKNLGVMYFLLGDRNESLVALQKANGLEPSDIWILYALSETLLAMGESEKGLAAIEQAIRLNPNPNGPTSFYFYGMRAEYHWKNGKPDSAIADWTKSITIAPYRHYDYKRRGLAHFVLKNYTLALADVAKAVEINPADGSNLTWISPKLVGECPDEKFRQGILKLADKAHKISGSNQVLVIRASLYVSVGFNLLKQERYIDAEPLLRKCLATREKLMPDDWLRFNTLSLLGGALLGQRKYAAAEPLLLEGYEGMKQREAKIPGEGKIRATEANERIVRLYEATEQAEKARVWREKLPAVKPHE